MDNHLQKTRRSASSGDSNGKIKGRGKGGNLVADGKKEDGDENPSASAEGDADSKTPDSDTDSLPDQDHVEDRVYTESQQPGPG